MRTVFTMAMKDLRLISRDWLGMFFIIGFPVMMGLFFGSMFGSVGDNDVTLTVAVVDEDDSTASQQFVKELVASGNIDVEKLDREAAMDSVRRGRLVGMIALPKGFGESTGFMMGKAPTIELGVDPSRKAEGAMLQGIILQTVGKSMFGQFQDPATVRKYVASIARATSRIGEDSGSDATGGGTIDRFARYAARQVGRENRQRQKGREDRPDAGSRVSTRPH